MILGHVGAIGALMTLTTFSMHRFRYLVPYTAGLLLLVGLVPSALENATSRLFDSLLHRLDTRTARRFSRGIAALLGLGLGLGLAYRLFDTTYEPARAHYVRAYGEIVQQHESMARELRTLPPDAVIGLTDAGILAYLGEHRTVDFIGLTYRGLAAQYVLGPGGLHESLEGLPRSDRPTHLVTYPRWWSARSLLGRELARREVPRPEAIVGEAVMTLQLPDYRGVFDAELPVQHDAPAEAVADALDVADLADEQAHAADFPKPEWARTPAIRDRVTNAAGERVYVSEGGRRIGGGRTRWTFVGAATRLILRVTTHGSTGLIVLVDDEERAHLDPEGGTQEIVVEAPEGGWGAGEHSIRLAARGDLVLSHAWWLR